MNYLRESGAFMNETAQHILAALADRRQIEPITNGHPGFDLYSAYTISDAIMAARIARGEHPVGWKIGFTNRTIWDEYDVHAPIWGPMYDTTVKSWNAAEGPLEIDVEAFVDPRLEPEIVFRMRTTPDADMDDAMLLACIDAVGHGFEIVQSIFPGWRFRAADTAAAAALHGALICGPLVPIDHAQTQTWLQALRSFEIDLLRDGHPIDHGKAANVLDGPLSALRHFVAGLAKRPMARGIVAGDLIATGTLTRAFPMSAGESWSTHLTSIDLPGMRVRFTGGVATLERLVAAAAEARFRLEHPDSCACSADYEKAVADGVATETTISRLLYRDPQRLVQARKSIADRAATKAQAWKNRPAS
jgi:2-keto-4-pentenoate hydratase